MMTKFEFSFAKTTAHEISNLYNEKKGEFNFSTNNIYHFPKLCLLRPAEFSCRVYLLETEQILHDHYQFVCSRELLSRPKRLHAILCCINDIWQNLSLISEGRRKIAFFDELEKLKFSVWIIKINRSNLYESTWTCPVYLKSWLCKHTAGMCIGLKLMSVPPETKLIPMGQKRKRGKSSKAKRALISQQRICGLSN